MKLICQKIGIFFILKVSRMFSFLFIPHFLSHSRCCRLLRQSRSCGKNNNLIHMTCIFKYLYIILFGLLTWFTYSLSFPFSFAQYLKTISQLKIRFSWHTITGLIYTVVVKSIKQHFDEGKTIVLQYCCNLISILFYNVPIYLS